MFTTVSEITGMQVSALSSSFFLPQVVHTPYNAILIY